jgi:hypothetical protein
LQVNEIKETFKDQINALSCFLDECISLLPNRDLPLIRFGGGTAKRI